MQGDSLTVLSTASLLSSIETSPALIVSPFYRHVKMRGKFKYDVDRRRQIELPYSSQI